MKEFSFLNSSIWIDDSFLGMSPEQKLVMVYLLTNPYSNWCGIYKLPLTTMANQLGLKERGLDSSFFAFAGQYKDLILFDEDTREVAILNWANMCLTKVSENTVKAARKELASVESQKLIWAMAAKTKSAGLKKIYSDVARTMQLTSNSAQDEGENDLTICSPENPHNSLIDNDLWSSSSSTGNGRVVLLEKEPKLCENSSLQEPISTCAANEQIPPATVRPKKQDDIPRRPPLAWDAVLRLRATPALDGTVSPSPTGDAWERRMYVFDAVRKKYPGTKSGLLQEFNGFLKKCWKDKLDLDKELSQMPYAVLYQIKWRESKEQAEEFAAAWKNFPSWINQAHWQSEMDSWKSRAEWFNQMCSAETKAKVEELKSILPCK